MQHEQRQAESKEQTSAEKGKKEKKNGALYPPFIIAVHGLFLALIRIVS